MNNAMRMNFYSGVYPYEQQTPQLLTVQREFGQPKYTYGGAVSYEPQNMMTPKIVSYCSLQKPVSYCSLQKPVKRLQDWDNKASVWDRLDKSKVPAMKNQPKRKNTIQNPGITRLLQPRNAVQLLQQIKPGSSFKVVEVPGSEPKKFTAYVELNNEMLASGMGNSKHQAKTNVAENVLKSLASEMTCKPVDEIAVKDAPNSEALVPLASYALYKLLKEWENKKNEELKVVIRPNPTVRQTKLKIMELPENPLSYHPTALLIKMMPGCQAIEIRRTPPPDSKVTMGYKIDGIIYTGTAQNKKEARKEAAKAVLCKYYGIRYPSQYLK